MKIWRAPCWPKIEMVENTNRNQLKNEVEEWFNVEEVIISCINQNLVSSPWAQNILAFIVDGREQVQKSFCELKNGKFLKN